MKQPREVTELGIDCCVSMGLKFLAPDPPPPQCRQDTSRTPPGSLALLLAVRHTHYAPSQQAVSRVPSTLN